MVVNLLRKLSPRISEEKLPESSDSQNPHHRWAKYTSTKDFCKQEFGESYAPKIEEVMDSVDSTVITIAKSSNGFGKSHAAARIATAFLCRYPNSQVYTAAAPPESNLDIILWGQIKDLVAQHPEVFSEFKVSTGKFIGRADSPLSFMIGLPIPQSSDSAQRKARFSGKHAPYILFVLDEGDAIPPDIYEAIESCMSGGFVRMLVMFNPRADVGPLARMERDGTGRVIRLNAFEHPNVVTGEDVFPGAVTREVTVRRINEWTVPLRPGEEIDAECFEVPSYLAGVVALSHAMVPYPPLPAGWRRVTNPAFSYMVLAQYPAVTVNQLIPTAAIERAVENFKRFRNTFGEVVPGRVRPSMGVDVAEYGMDSTVVTLKYDSIVLPQNIWRFTNPKKTADLCAEIYKSRRVRYANVDANGVGAGVAPAMADAGCRTVYGLKVQSRPELKNFSDEQAEIGEFALLGDYIMWSVREWLINDPHACIPDDEELIEELKFYTYVVKKGKYITASTADDFRAGVGRSPDKSKSLGLAVCGEFEEIAGEISIDNYIYGTAVHKGNFIHSPKIG